MDVTQLILEDHHEQRRLFALLEQVEPADTGSLTALWGRLAAFLELHAYAEEQVFYPALLNVGEGAGGKPTSESETKDAIHDHNEIRDAVSAVGKHSVGTQSWYQAVADANKVNGDHMAEEEREALTDFRRNASLETRNELGVAFVSCEATHVLGVESVDKDPDEYIAEHE
jgi:hypothetical protein